MGIDSHGNNGHSHSHTGCFPFIPILIPNFVTNFHYHVNPMDSHSHCESHSHGHLYFVAMLKHQTLWSGWCWGRSICSSICALNVVCMSGWCPHSCRCLSRLVCASFSLNSITSVSLCVCCCPCRYIQVVFLSHLLTADHMLLFWEHQTLFI